MHCPWKQSTDPNDIPNGYNEKLHEGLDRTIAEPGAFHGGDIHVMACHETRTGAELPCVGWLAHQLGPGNNLALRMRVINKQIDGDVETVGPQHKRFEDTLPKKRRKKKAK
jgi:hypothetical protein